MEPTRAEQRTCDVPQRPLKRLKRQDAVYGEHAFWNLPRPSNPAKPNNNCPIEMITSTTLYNNQFEPMRETRHLEKKWKKERSLSEHLASKESLKPFTPHEQTHEWSGEVTGDYALGLSRHKKNKKVGEIAGALIYSTYHSDPTMSGKVVNDDLTALLINLRRNSA